jgi:hypothetical protein
VETDGPPLLMERCLDAERRMVAISAAEEQASDAVIAAWGDSTFAELAHRAAESAFAADASVKNLLAMERALVVATRKILRMEELDAALDPLQAQYDVGWTALTEAWASVGAWLLESISARADR